MASYSELTLPPPPSRDASLIMQSHALSLVIGKCMEIIVESIPEKNLVDEFHCPRSKFVSCDKSSGRNVDFKTIQYKP